MDRETLAPVEGALVQLLDSTGADVDGRLTNAAGRFLVEAPRPGTYRVRAERIGFETVTSPPLHLAPGGITDVRLETGTLAIALEGLTVEGRQRCVVRPGEGELLSGIWEEARKALEAQEWTEEKGLYRYRILTWVRELDPEFLRVRKETRRVTTAVTRTPVRSLPAEDLAESGFIRPVDDGGYEYYGPDASVLLSDPFLDTHCLRLAADEERPGLLGLAFEPVGRRGVPDIEGIFWLDRETLRLRSLDYRYTWSPWVEARGVAGGRVDFEELPNGAWIVRRWWIRMPIMGRDMGLRRLGGSGLRLVSVKEDGGEITRITTLSRRLVSRSRTGSLSGIVWDSTRYRGLAGAEVLLEGTEYRTTTDSLGRFLLQDLPQGAFTLTFRHPRLDTLGAEPERKEVVITAGKHTLGRLGVPSIRTLLTRGCLEEEGASGGSVVAGRVRDRTSGEPIPRARVTFFWSRYDIRDRGPTLRGRQGVQISESRSRVEAYTDTEGRYRACGLPPDELLVARADFLERESDTVHVRLLEEAYAVLDLEIELPPGFLRTVGAPGAAAVGELAGTQGIQGRVVEAGSERPLEAVEVGLYTESGELLGSTRTNDRGFFRLPTPRPGRYTLRGEALGYAPAGGGPVEVGRGRLTVVELRLAPEAIPLEPLVVVGTPRLFHLEMAGFYDRRERTSGVFLTREELGRRNPERLTDLFWGIPGARLIQDQTGQYAVYFRGAERTGGRICWPRVFLDRQLVHPGGFEGGPAVLNGLMDPLDLAGLEVYRTPAEIPSEFSGPNSACGVILLWSRRGEGGGT